MNKKVVIFLLAFVHGIACHAQGKGRFGTGIGYTFVDWIFDKNWGGNANWWSGYLGFNAYRNDDDPKDYFYGINSYTAKNVFEGSNARFRRLYSYTANNHEQHKLKESMCLRYNGYLGLGISNPSQLLTLKSSRPRIASSDKEREASVLEFNEYANQLRIQHWNQFGAHYQKTIMSLDMDNGFIGMGTDDPKSKLDVRGAIKATEIKVEAQTADFVFEDYYRLKDLSEVEESINTNKHLSYLPSAKQMEENGVGLTEMNKLLRNSRFM